MGVVCSQGEERLKEILFFKNYLLWIRYFTKKNEITNLINLKIYFLLGEINWVML